MVISLELGQYLMFIIPFLLLLIPLYFIIRKAVQKAIEEAKTELEKERKDV